jgi:hypothetical protein
MHIKEILCGDVHWIVPYQRRVQCCALMNTLLGLQLKWDHKGNCYVDKLVSDGPVTAKWLRSSCLGMGVFA